MESFANKLRALLVVLFACALVVLGIWLFVEVLMGRKTFGQALGIVGGAILGASLVIWAATDFAGPQTIIAKLGSWFGDLLDLKSAIHNIYLM